VKLGRQEQDHGINFCNHIQQLHARVPSRHSPWSCQSTSRGTTQAAQPGKQLREKETFWSGASGEREKITVS
jgi:hypothetical protein